MQAALAKTHGVDGFCYYHYWFNGRRLLDLPFNEVLRSGEPDFPFMLCWANENWTRRWDGAEHEVLLAQNYSLEDDREHIRSLLPAFHWATTTPAKVPAITHPLSAPCDNQLPPDIE